MHALHCLLVEVDAPVDVSALTAEEMDEIKWEVRQKALAVLDSYEGQVFDYYDEEGAGRWEDEFPGRGVVLGAEEPERFRELLLEFKDRPLKKALEMMEYVEYEDLRWRSREEIESDPGIEVLPDDENGHLADSAGRPLYWSGRPAPRLEIGRTLIEKVWREGGIRYDYLSEVLKLVTAEYTFDSGFYSVPDYSPRIGVSTLQNALANPEKYALVFVDCHR